jgi:hypothetical protein
VTEKSENSRFGTRNLSVVAPKTKSIDQLKREFIKVLKLTYGNVSRASAASGLPRRTAYNHRAVDPRFAEEWHDAVAFGYDLVDEKLRHEALKEKPVPSILIYAHKNVMNQKKWRGRLIHAAKAGVEAMQAKAVELGIPRAQIEEIREAMFKAYEKIPLV